MHSNPNRGPFLCFHGSTHSAVAPVFPLRLSESDRLGFARAVFEVSMNPRYSLMTGDLPSVRIHLKSLLAFTAPLR